MSTVPEVEQLAAEIPAGPPLTQLTAARELTEKLRARGDAVLDQFVYAARTGGASWSEIGCALGTSKQAAQQRFAVLADSPAGQAPFGITGPGADVLMAAQAQARELGHHYVRPEHLVLGLLALPEELAAEALARLGVTADCAREAVEQRLGRRAPRPNGSLGVAPPTKRLLEMARAVAKPLGHRCPRTEHILLAAVTPSLQSPAAAVLAECGAPPARVRDEVARMLVNEAPELAERLTNPSLWSRVRLRF